MKTMTNKLTAAFVARKDREAARALQSEAITRGALKAEPDCDKYRVPAVA